MKKGFTLIELLAVIVILAIIALIATPMILGVIKSAKKGSIEDGALNYIDAFEKSKAEDIILNQDITILKEGTYKVSDFKFKYKGIGPSEGTIEINQDGEVASADLCIEDYFVHYDGKHAKIDDSKGCGDIADGGVLPPNVIVPVEPPEIKEETPTKAINEILKQGIVTTGTGLYKNPIELEGGYVFKGGNPNNFLRYDQKCFSIIALTYNNQIKVIYEGPVNASGTCDGVRTASNGGLPNSGMADYWYYSTNGSRRTLESIADPENTTNRFLTDFSLVGDHDWYVGRVEDKDLTFQDVIEQEKYGRAGEKAPELPMTQNGVTYTYYGWKNKIGLVNLSDAFKASAEPGCNNLKAASGYPGGVCHRDNYLRKNYTYWVLNSRNIGVFWEVSDDADILLRGSNVSQASASYPLRPVLYFKSSVTVAGTGTGADPYTIS